MQKAQRIPIENTEYSEINLFIAVKLCYARTVKDYVVANQ